MNALDVYLHEELVGRLERLPQARLRFTYEPSRVETGGVPLSFSLPLRAEPFGDEECRPFFEGLLPEGDFLRAIARAFHVSADNPFALLGEIGGECAGAVSLVPQGARPPIASAPDPEWLTEPALGELVDELPRRPLLAGDEEGIRLSLAGTRDKLPVLCRDDRIGITRGMPPSTHIVKIPIPQVADTIANEAYCMTLADSMGLAAAQAVPHAAAGREYLLVRRYDREATTDGGVRRIHQEDLCQALGFVPALKYAAEGGPDVAACAVFLSESSAAPAIDLLAFLDALLFSLIVGNHDAHAKNFSILLEGEGAPRLAPLYDLISTWAYGRQFHRRLAMKYGGENRPDYIRGRHLERLAEDLGIAPRLMRDRAHELTGRVDGAKEEARQRLPPPWRDRAIVDAIDQVIERNGDTLRHALAELP